jgi:hypothetical protein
MERTTTFQGDTADTFVSITSAPDAPEDATEGRHLDFIVANWAALAAGAHEGYQRHGVGAVVVPREVVVGPDAPPLAFLAQRMLYGTPGGAWMGTTPRAGAIRWIDAATDTYDPLDEVLIVVLAAKRPRAYRARASLSPPQAFARLRATLN